jgi:transposase
MVFRNSTTRLHGRKDDFKDYIQPFRETAKKKYTICCEMLPGEQMQVDWKEVGKVMSEGRKVKLSLFADTLGYSRMKFSIFIPFDTVNSGCKFT